MSKFLAEIKGQRDYYMPVIREASSVGDVPEVCSLHGTGQSQSDLEIHWQIVILVLRKSVVQLVIVAWDMSIRFTHYEREHRWQQIGKG